MNRLLKQQGLTLVEIMITLIIAAVLIATTAPSLMSMILNNRLSSLHNSLLSDLTLARNTSVNGGNFVILCASNSRRKNCNNNAKIWTHGWLVFEDLNEDERVSSGESILLVSNRPDQSITLSSDIPKVKFSSEGTAIGYANTFALCDTRGDSAKKGLKLSSSGSAQSADASDIELACP